MRHLAFPTDKEQSQSAVIDLVRQSLAAGQQVRILVLVARETHETPWRPVCGRFDMVRRGEGPGNSIRPTGNVRIVEERLEGDEFLRRLGSALHGGPFHAADIELREHGMDSTWDAYHHHTDWRDYGSDWPCTIATPSNEVKQRPRILEAIEADGPIPVFKNLEQVAWKTMGFVRSSSQGRDVRVSRFQLLIWDYRGRINRFQADRTRVIVEVSPPNDPTLRLALVAEGDTAEVPYAKTGPAVETVDVGETVLRATASLRKGDELLAHHSFDFPLQSAISALDDTATRDGQVVPPQDGTAPVGGPGKPPRYGPWVLIRPIGQGGQGIAHLARDEENNRIGVIKVLRERDWPNSARRSKAVERFRREIGVACSLRHPFLLQVLDADADAREPWVVTEYLRGRSLEQNLAAFRGDPWRTLRVARDIAVGLAALHEKGLVHRDVKPANIFLRDVDHAVLGDFGIVHDPDAIELTSTSEKVASSWYGPPESEDGRLDEPSPSFDVYSLGKVIYVTLTGGKKFPREDFLTVKTDVTNVFRKPALASVNRILRRMVVADPDRRYQSMDSVVDAIDTSLAELLGKTRPGQCHVCTIGEYEHKGNLVLTHGTLRHGSGELHPIVEICSTCGDVRLAVAGHRSNWTTSRKNRGQ